MPGKALTVLMTGGQQLESLSYPSFCLEVWWLPGDQGATHWDEKATSQGQQTQLGLGRPWSSAEPAHGHLPSDLKGGKKICRRSIIYNPTHSNLLALSPATPGRPGWPSVPCSPTTTPPRPPRWSLRQALTLGMRLIMSGYLPVLSS